MREGYFYFFPPERDRFLILGSSPNPLVKRGRGVEGLFPIKFIGESFVRNSFIVNYIPKIVDRVFAKYRALELRSFSLEPLAPGTLMGLLTFLEMILKLYT